MEDRPPTILVLGAGYGGIAAARSLERSLRGRQHPPAIVLVDQHPHHQLITRLHEVAAGTLEPGAAAVPLPPVLAGRRIQFVCDRVRAIDRRGKRVVLDHGLLPYDSLVFALGSETALFGIPGLTEDAFCLRWLAEAMALRDHLGRVLRRAADERDPARRTVLQQVVVGGGGYTGVELITEIADGLQAGAQLLAKHQQRAPLSFALTLLEAGPQIMAGFRPDLVREARCRLAQKGIAVKTMTGITAVEPETVHLSTGDTLRAGTIIWTGGIRASPLVEGCGLATSHRGRATVNAYLQSISDPAVYVVGDSAFATDPATGAPLAPSAQLAVKQGAHVARTIQRALLGLEPRPFAPGRLATIVSLGTDDALADLGWTVLRGRPARILKHLAVIRYLYSLNGIGLALRHAPEVLEGIPIIGTPPGRLAA